MKKEIITKLKITFEDYVNEADGIELCFARDLQVIENHFVDINKKVKIGSGAEREIDKLVYELYGLAEGEIKIIEGG
ncbi:hypothetical protein BEH94_10075 [Candidatus Altiarchaeales archaeon WOR_SM1_SCG]|nr:hypothetical protein BEH94_10075 [Candidatus Altiarchaeales archaeon WOR_SM1_SCG]